MSDIEFFRTQMGQKFFEQTVPSLVKELARLNDNLEQLNRTLGRSEPQQPSSADPTERP